MSKATVNTADFKNNLSRYLKTVRETDKSLTVCDGNKPIVLVIPFDKHKNDNKSVWDLIKEDEERFGCWDEDFSIPERNINKLKFNNPLEE